MQLNEKTRDDLRSLLEDHTKVVDALFNLGKPAFEVALTVNDEKNGDSTEVPVHVSVAKKALLAHKEWVDAELKKLGVEITAKTR